MEWNILNVNMIREQKMLFGCGCAAGIVVRLTVFGFFFSRLTINDWRFEPRNRSTI
ncbi:MAG: hypothetical protein AB1546_15535 [bacterium]